MLLWGDKQTIDIPRELSQTMNIFLTTILSNCSCQFFKLWQEEEAWFETRTACSWQCSTLKNWGYLSLWCFITDIKLFWIWQEKGGAKQQWDNTSFWGNTCLRCQGSGLSFSQMLYRQFFLKFWPSTSQSMFSNNHIFYLSLPLVFLAACQWQSPTKGWCWA